MMNANDFAHRTLTQRELENAIAEAHLQRSRAFRAGLQSVVAFFSNLVPTGGAYLTHGRVAIR